MKTILLCAACLTGVLAGIGTWAQGRIPTRFSGVIHDYLPLAGGTTAWEVRGPWSWDLNEETHTANFSAGSPWNCPSLGRRPITYKRSFLPSIPTTSREKRDRHLQSEGCPPRPRPPRPTPRKLRSTGLPAFLRMGCRAIWAVLAVAGLLSWRYR